MVKHERFAVAVLILIALYAAWFLVGRVSDERCRYAGDAVGGFFCSRRAPVDLPPDATDLRRV